jgi:hypothetical protein
MEGVPDYNIQIEQNSAVIVTTDKKGSGLNMVHSGYRARYS